MAVEGAKASSSGAGGVFKITISAVTEKLQYDKKEFTVKSGQKVELKFVNADYPPHNLMIVNPGTADAIAKAAIELGGKGFELEFKPKSPDVLHHTGMIDYEGVKVLKFTAPAKPGDYQYVCTFPGHAIVMRGMMKVTK